MRQLPTNEGGFTFIELLAIVMILGILALVALPNYFGVQGNAQASVRASNVEAINTALALYLYRNGVCPGAGAPESFTAFLSDTLYFPDGPPVDPTVSPVSDTPYINNYSSATCRTK